jgi:two-component system, NtrC family, response regulator AtoC
MAATSHIKGDTLDSGLILSQCQSFNAMVQAIASTDIPVLIAGESGTGKEVCARLIHQLSEFRSGPLKRVNCADSEIAHLLSQLKEELRPTDRAKGPYVRTLFLDRIEELDLNSQRTLLSLLSEGESEAAGDLSVRLISSTTHTLEHETEAGFFRRELYFRISGAILRLPPLRERRENIPALIEWFLTKYANEFTKTRPTLSVEALAQLSSYHWPGNVRELEHAAKKIVALGDPAMVLRELHAPPPTPKEDGVGGRLSPLKTAARAASRKTERELILQALQRTRWNRKRAASELRISYKSLLYKIKQIGALESETRS